MSEKSILEFIIKQAAKIAELKAEVRELRDNGCGKICNTCGERMVSLPSMDKRICSCGLSDFKLKKGQKSILENKIGV